VFASVNRHLWSLSTGYAHRKDHNEHIALHRYLVDAPKYKVVDHINGNPLDNRRSNLRVCDVKANTRNLHKKKVTTSRYKGVSLLGGRWRVTLYAQGKQHYVGSYEDEEVAAHAYDAAVRAENFEVVTVNFPKEGEHQAVVAVSEHLVNREQLVRQWAEPVAVVGARWVQLGHGNFALVDEDDYERVNASKWTRSGAGYAWTRAGNKSVSMHRFVMRAVKDVTIDHVSGDGLDNRKSNLRRCSRRQNSGNQRVRRTTKSSRYKGVSINTKTGKWMAMLSAKYLGTFTTQEEAAKAYDDASRTTYGEFARLNFPEGNERSVHV
jgi:hypothetical protein